jgi:nitroreductase
MPDVARVGAPLRAGRHARARAGDLVNEALTLAQWAPSNSNIQPWRLVFVSGTARARLKDGY